MFVRGIEVMLGNLAVCTRYVEGGEVEVTIMIKLSACFQCTKPGSYKFDVLRIKRLLFVL